MVPDENEQAAVELTANSVTFGPEHVFLQFPIAGGLAFGVALKRSDIERWSEHFREQADVAGRETSKIALVRR
jgi:hypothetical protein